MGDMSLEEFVKHLPKTHRVRLELLLLHTERDELKEEVQDLIEVKNLWINIAGERAITVDKAEAENNELKRELFLEGVKNNSDRARTEFLEAKIKELLLI
jgi:head-tail adaptor